jgi:hypothetical protein
MIGGNNFHRPWLMPAHKVAWSFFSLNGGLMTHLAPSLFHIKKHPAPGIECRFPPTHLISSCGIANRIQSAFTGKMNNIARDSPCNWPYLQNVPVLLLPLLPVAIDNDIEEIIFLLPGAWQPGNRSYRHWWHER